MELNPSYKNKIPEFGLFLIKNQRYDEALALIEAIQDEAKLKFQFYFLKGRALMGLGHYNEAIESLRMGNVIYNSDAPLLAALGTCYYKTGDKARALAALKASLKLNPEQTEVKSLIQEIEGKK
jgi:tetratricopeptide (TPR) repeat protein